MNKNNQKSAKDKAFERERAKLRSQLQQKNDEIIRLNQEVAKYKVEAESWEKTAKILETYIGIPKEEILAEIERSKKISSFLDLTTLISKYL